MRTTVDLPDALIRKAKMTALERGATLRELIIQGLESVLHGTGNPARRLMNPPVHLAADSPLRSLDAGQLGRLDAESEAAEIHELHHRR